ncbi:Hpt domain-containing protein [Hyphomonas sp.]|uniref:Hpt domain-containing protein n=1 Tax=Hyphomonas sp. TaxID=87 RepID=UPI0035651A1D
MISKLFGKFLPSKTASMADARQIQTPDISRVIKIRPTVPTPETAADVAESADPADMADRAEAAVDSLSGQFEAWMTADLDKLVAAWRDAQVPEATPEAYRAVFTASHNIRGVAGSYGYPAISRLCGSLSTLLNDTHPGENSALINLHIEACRAAFVGVGSGDSAASVADAVCDALEQSVAAKTASN